MAMPKSVTRVKKDGVEYVSSVDRVNYTIHELSRAALRDTAKFLRRRIKDAAPKASGRLRDNIATWVRRDRQTGESRLQVGVYDQERAKRKGIPYAFYAGFLELGTVNQQAANSGRGFMRFPVLENIDEIRKIQGQYLSAIEDENKAIGLIDEEEEVADD